MPIGTDDGQYFEDGMEQRSKGITIRPAADSTMPPGGPTEPAGALKSSGYGPIPAEGVKVNPWVTITPEDIDTGISVGMSAGPGTMAGVKGLAGDLNRIGPEQINKISKMHEAQNMEEEMRIGQAIRPNREEIEDATRDIFEKEFKERGDRFATEDEMKTLRDDPLAFHDVIDRRQFNEAFPGWDFTHSVLHPDPMSIPDEVFANTGWFRGADSRWKFEISDQGTHINPAGFKMVPNEFMRNNSLEEKLQHMRYRVPKEGTTVGQIFNHKELFDVYPDLKNIRIEPVSGFDMLTGTKGWHRSARGSLPETIALSTASLGDLRSTLLHELQHAIQDREGFSKGASSDMFKSDRWKSLFSDFTEFKNNLEQKIRDDYGGDLTKVWEMKEAVKNEKNIPILEKKLEEEKNVPFGWISPWSKREYEKIKENLQLAKEQGYYEPLKKIIKGEDIANRYDTALHEKYQSVKGETESRNVQHRRDYTPEERQAIPPYSTEMPAREHQIWSPLDPDWLKNTADLQ